MLQMTEKYAEYGWAKKILLASEKLVVNFLREKYYID
jgi:hypothetical protein